MCDAWAVQPANDTLRHVLAQSCGRCIYLQRDFQAKKYGCDFYEHCKAHKPLMATASVFSQKGT